MQTNASANASAKDRETDLTRRPRAAGRGRKLKGASRRDRTKYFPYSPKRQIPATERTERRKPRRPQQAGSSSSIARAAAHNAEKPCPRLPTRLAPADAQLMIHARTADEGAPHITTKAAETLKVRKTFTDFFAPHRNSPADKKAHRRLKWLPDTATRCEAPQAANSSSSPKALNSAESPQIAPAAITLPSCASPPPDSASSAARSVSRRCRSGLCVLTAPVTVRSLTEPEIPRIREDLPHSSSAFGVKRPTPVRASPRAKRSGVESQTEPTRVSPASTPASLRHPPVDSRMSPSTTNSHDETLDSARASAVPSTLSAWKLASRSETEKEKQARETHANTGHGFLE